jgi:hypothetical protein
LCSTNNVGNEVEEEGNDDSDMVGFEEEGFAAESLRSL